MRNYGARSSTIANIETNGLENDLLYYAFKPSATSDVITSMMVVSALFLTITVALFSSPPTGTAYKSTMYTDNDSLIICFFYFDVLASMCFFMNICSGVSYFINASLLAEKAEMGWYNFESAYFIGWVCTVIQL